jgi:hypothetical protein
MMTIDHRWKRCLDPYNNLKNGQWGYLAELYDYTLILCNYNYLQSDIYGRLFVITLLREALTLTHWEKLRWGQFGVNFLGVG